MLRALDVDERIGGHEKDAIVSLAGWAANRHENPHLVPFDVFTDDDGDSLNARSSTMHIITLEDRKSPPVGGSVKIETDETLQTRIYQIWFRLLRRTDALVVQHWLAIERVGKHLERHRRIDNQAELDDLIARAERLAIT